jgi:hypothetical protein
MSHEPAQPGLAICALCREWIDTTDLTLQYAVELHPVGRWGDEFIEGRGAFFHAACYPWVRGYRPKPHPRDWTAASES